MRLAQRQFLSIKYHVNDRLVLHETDAVVTVIGFFQALDVSRQLIEWPLI